MSVLNGHPVLSEALERVIGFTRVADAKAAPLLALQASLAGLALGDVQGLKGVLSQGWADLESYFVWPAFVTYVLAAAASWGLAALVYVPRTPRDEGSLLYFEEIRRKTLPMFCKELNELDDEQLERQYLRQIHAVSRIASRKFNWVRWSFITGTLALVAWATVMAWARYPR